MNKNIAFALQILGFFILISATLWSCKGNNDKVPGEDVIAVVDGAKLYKQDLIKIIPEFNNPEDSAAFVDEYIQNWIADQLLFIEAKKNLTDTTMIVKKLNDFRQQLYIHYYKESILFADIKTEVTQTEIDDYYNKHLQDYVLATSYVKAHYLTMDAKVTAYSDEWEKVSNSGPEDKKMLKDYCIGTGRKIYFIEEWTEIRNFLDIVNYSGEFSESELGSRNVLDYINGSLRYLVKIDEFRSKGDFLPVELAVPEITQIIINNRKDDKLIQVKKDLKESATSAGTVIINK